ncbi:chorismate-binding protein [Ornithinicoccus hortensis]|uniref:anthranilate synthase n=1 Tax=Ornithinicoccus hortensis TaxID=82346 RepID=A0A542YNQ3_9MICO|nr:chorismate-binding protein [Ornithinicoccus hortensis]TQL49728.1 phenazine biosynthesis protein phzE [Ornithinicoccus hortensis]
MYPVLDAILRAPADQAWALLWREGQETVEVLRGTTADVARLADIPAAEEGHPVLAMVPFRQIAERGFAVRDDGTPLRVLTGTAYERVPVEAVVAALPTGEVEVTDERFSVSDEDYAAIVSRVIEEEIGNGEGANFVIRRDVLAHTATEPATAALTWLRRLLTDERGAYWTFAVHTPGHTLVGATPERHVSVEGGRVRMNPISGTFRHPADMADLEPAFRSFIADTKETEELFMVVDEEMKMMSQICTDGGRITGPYLKQMAHLTHTEYLLDGRSDADPRDVLRLTMFAPTVTGSPMENACTVITRHEPGGRGYYSGVLALLERDADGGEQLDAPILIRTAHLDDEGTVTVSAGATLVRHSDPVSEVAETTAKASGMLAALGLRPRRDISYAVPLAELDGVAEALGARNESLSPFWLSPQEARPDPDLLGRRVLVVDAADTWTQMLAHQVRHFGMAARVARWDEVTEQDLAAVDLVLFGPGPGDPDDPDDPRVTRLRDLLAARLAAGGPVLAVCLSHQILSRLAGLDVTRLERPNQGVQLPVDLWGHPARIGFYNTFVPRPGDAVVERAGVGTPLEAAVDPAHDAVVGLRGPGVASIQGHAESVLSRDGLGVLHRLIRHALGHEAGFDTEMSDIRRPGGKVS